jgi:hypothetical protein
VGVTIGNGVTGLGNFAFASCTSLTNVNIGNRVTRIGSDAFSSCNRLASITIPNGVTNLGDYSFTSCTRLSSVVIPNSVACIGRYAFYNCTSLASVTIGGSVTSIGEGAFDTCSSLPSIVVPNSVTNIGGTAFAFCAGLTNVTLGSGVTNIGDYAFSSCTKLTAVYCQGNAPIPGVSVFYNDFGSTTVYRLPGTSGWASTHAGHPVALWNLTVQASFNGFGVRTNQFGFNITSTGGVVVVVEACTDLAHPIWTPLQTNTLAGNSSYFSDPQWTNYPARLYRLRSP